MNQEKLLAILKKEISPLFDKTAKILSKSRSITDKNLDGRILEILIQNGLKNKNLEIKFSAPKDDIYKTEAGRTPYDILGYGNINKIPFKIFINNKWGNIKNRNKNDITTYNNLLRLYLNINTQRLTEKIEIDKKIIYKRIVGEDIVVYGVFAIDKNTRQHRFFFLNEIDGKFYVNPRNTLFQVEYNPKLIKIPLDFYNFSLSMIDSATIALGKAINKAKTEIIVLQQIKNLMIGLEKNVKNS